MASVKIYRVNDKLEWRDEVAERYGLLWVRVEGNLYRSIATGALSSWDPEYLEEVEDD